MTEINYYTVDSASIGRLKNYFTITYEKCIYQVNIFFYNKDIVYWATITFYFVNAVNANSFVNNLTY